MNSEPRDVRFERDGKVGVITLDRPPLNAYDDHLHYQLEQCWRAAADDPEVRAVVFRADGKHFCGGADLGREPRPAPGPHLTPWDEYRLIRELPKPTIAAVQGGCVGGGQRMVWPCDLIFCSEDAFFRDPTASMGIGGIQAAGHTWAYGPRLAKEMLFGGQRLPAERLYQMGLINRLIPRERLLEETLAFAREVAEQDPFALRQAKRSVNTTLDIMGQHYLLSRFAELMDGSTFRPPRR